MIDLKKLYNEHPECFEDSEKFRAYLVDLYPNEKKARINVLVTLLSEGVHTPAKSEDKFDDLAFCEKICDDYGYDKNLVKEGFALFAKIFRQNVEGAEEGIESEEEIDPNYPTIENYDEKEFEIEGTVLKKYKKNGKLTKIPYGITAIGASAFKNHKALEEVIIPRGVISIEESAFYGCSSLRCVTIPYGAVSIGVDSFCLCESLCRIKIPSSVTCIGQAAFMHSGLIGDILIPNSVTHIGRDAFWNCHVTINCEALSEPKGWERGWKSTGSAKDVVVWGYGKYSSSAIEQMSEFDVDYPTLQNYDKKKFQIVGTMLLKFISQDIDWIEKIPLGVKTIGDHAFQGCPFRSIIIPSSVESIQNNAFENCNNINHITIPQGVTSIGQGAFYRCRRLEDITIPQGMKSIGENVFSECSSLKNIAIPQSVTSIGESAFSGCSSLENITIPQGVISIGEGAFSGCSSLKSVMLPQSVTSIGGSTFTNCDSLEIIEVAKGNTVYHSNNNCIIKTKKKILVAGCANSIIPDDGSVTTIGKEAFDGCKLLLNLIIPDSVTSIESYAFCGCRSLENIIIPSSVKFVGEHIFSCCKDNLIILCEADSLPADWDPEWDTYYEPYDPDCQLHRVYFGYKK